MSSSIFTSVISQKPVIGLPLFVSPIKKSLHENGKGEAPSMVSPRSVVFSDSSFINNFNFQDQRDDTTTSQIDSSYDKDATDRFDSFLIKSESPTTSELSAVGEMVEQDGTPQGQDDDDYDSISSIEARIKSEADTLFQSIFDDSEKPFLQISGSDDGSNVEEDTSFQIKTEGLNLDNSFTSSVSFSDYYDKENYSKDFDYEDVDEDDDNLDVELSNLMNITNNLRSEMQNVHMNDIEDATTTINEKEYNDDENIYEIEEIDEDDDNMDFKISSLIDVTDSSIRSDVQSVKLIDSEQLENREYNDDPHCLDEKERLQDRKAQSGTSNNIVTESPEDDTIEKSSLHCSELSNHDLFQHNENQEKFLDIKKIKDESSFRSWIEKNKKALILTGGAAAFTIAMTICRPSLTSRK